MADGQSGEQMSLSDEELGLVVPEKTQEADAVVAQVSDQAPIDDVAPDEQKTRAEIILDKFDKKGVPNGKGMIPISEAITELEKRMSPQERVIRESTLKIIAKATFTELERPLLILSLQDRLTGIKYELKELTSEYDDEYDKNNDNPAFNHSLLNSLNKQIDQKMVELKSLDGAISFLERAFSEN